MRVSWNDGRQSILSSLLFFFRFGLVWFGFFCSLFETSINPFVLNDKKRFNVHKLLQVKRGWKKKLMMPTVQNNKVKTQMNNIYFLHTRGPHTGDLRWLRARTLHLNILFQSSKLFEMNVAHGNTSGKKRAANNFAQWLKRKICEANTNTAHPTN